MNDFIINSRTAGEILAHIGQARKELLSHGSKENELLIFMPHYVEMAFRLWVAPHVSMWAFGMLVRTGYDQEKIIITNSGGDRFLERVYNHVITYVDQKVIYNNVAPEEHYG